MAIVVDSVRAAKAVPIVIVQSESFDAYLAHTEARTRAWLCATEFRGRPHTHALVPSANGGIAQVLVGIKDANDVYALSHLPLAVPAGDYTIASHHDALTDFAAA